MPSTRSRHACQLFFFRRTSQLGQIVLSGDSNVGKTSLIVRFTEHTFVEGRAPTLDGDFIDRVVDVDGVPVRLQIWDTAGQGGGRVAPPRTRAPRVCVSR